MLELIPQNRTGGGARLTVSAYLADFSAHYPRVSGVFWKLERGQAFREPDVPSWAAAAKGDWADALRLIEPMRAEVVAEFASAPAMRRRRIRVAEAPVSAYLQWEMQVLKMRAELGEQVRVLDAALIQDWERERPLPEVVILGDAVMYEICYADDGSLAGAYRITAPEVIAACADELAGMFRQGEDLATYFDREIAPLPAPSRL